MATDVRNRTLPGDHRVSFLATWDDYQAIARAVGDQHVRLAYDGERVELMSPSTEHEEYKELMAYVVRALATGLRVPYKCMGSSRWERPAALRAIESDTCFYLTPEKIAVARTRPKADADWPLPDLAVEIDLSPSKVDRPGIYAALGVPEVWRFDGATLRIDRLGPDDTYAVAPESEWLGVRPEEVVHLLSIDAEDDNDFSEQALAWARDVLAPRRGA
jgi:Uma2 family endonuclease